MVKQSASEVSPQVFPEQADEAREASPEQASPPKGLEVERLVQENIGWLRGWFRARIMDPNVVDDLCQDTFLKAFRSLHQLRDPERFSAWLYRTATNLLRDHWRRKETRGRKVVYTGDFEDVVGASSPENDLSSAEQAERLLAAVQALPERYREPFLLRHAKEMSYEEISKILGITENSVRVRIFRARQMLRESCSKS